jgi:anthranilate synthase component 1
MDLAITIRTCVIADGVASVQVGAGIVHDSEPSREWEETESKARALLTAIGQARAVAPGARRKGKTKRSRKQTSRAKRKRSS